MKGFLVNIHRISYWKGAFLLAAFALFAVLFPYLNSEANIISLGTQSVGSVKLPKGSTQTGDFVIAIFSDNLIPDPALQNRQSHFPQSENPPLAGCLSVAKLHLHSGVPTLMSPGEIIFGCKNVPEEASVYGWINGQWEKVPSTINSYGEMKARFTEVTLYAIFPSTPNKTEATLLGQI